jgi:sulfhydrogenase subunit delta
MTTHARPKVAVFKFASCDGCQLALLNLEDALLELAEKIDIAYFLEARSDNAAGPYDISFVEGSITTADDVERIEEIRKHSGQLIAIGACATSGGIQALRNWKDRDTFIRQVYATPSYIRTLDRSTPISMHVPVDYELGGCPVDKYQLLEVIVSALIGRKPHIPAHAVCIDCKRNGNICVAVAAGASCLGPITHTGCGAICPAFGRGCYGCFGPSELSRPEVLADHLIARGASRREVIRLFRTFTGYQQPMRGASESLEKNA